MKKLTILSLIFCTSCIGTIQRGKYSYSNRWEIAANANLQIEVKKRELVDLFILNESPTTELLVKVANIENLILPKDSLQINQIGPGIIHIKNKGNSSTLTRVRLDKLTRKLKINEANLTY